MGLLRGYEISFKAMLATPKMVMSTSRHQLHVMEMRIISRHARTSSKTIFQPQDCLRDGCVELLSNKYHSWDQQRSMLWPCWPAPVPVQKPSEAHSRTDIIATAFGSRSKPRLPTLPAALKAAASPPPPRWAHCFGQRLACGTVLI